MTRNVMASLSVPLISFFWMVAGNPQLQPLAEQAVEIRAEATSDTKASETQLTKEKEPGTNPAKEPEPSPPAPLPEDDAKPESESAAAPPDDNNDSPSAGEDEGTEGSGNDDSEPDDTGDTSEKERTTADKERTSGQASVAEAKASSHRATRGNRVKSKLRTLKPGSSKDRDWKLNKSKPVMLLALAAAQANECVDLKLSYLDSGGHLQTIHLYGTQKDIDARLATIPESIRPRVCDALDGRTAFDF